MIRFGTSAVQRGAPLRPGQRGTSPRATFFIKQGGFFVAAGRSLLAGDFSAEVEGRAYGVINGRYGLYFGSGDAGFYAFRVQNGGYRFSTYQNSTKVWTTLAYQASHPAVMGGGPTNRIKVQRIDSNITIHVNGQQVAQATDSTYGQGYAGLFAEALQPDFGAFFDDFLLVFTPANP